LLRSAVGIGVLLTALCSRHYFPSEHDEYSLNQVCPETL
jgi:hypothetical protein